jgi:phosphate transport system substrate-binding protein
VDGSKAREGDRVKRLLAAVVIIGCAASVLAQMPDINQIPKYAPQVKVAGAMRVYGTDLKGQMVIWEQAFQKFHPDVVWENSFATSSEGGIAGMYIGISDMAPMGDDAKITDVMPFYNVFHYLPTEYSVATGGYEKRGTLWAIQIVVNKDNPLTKLTMEQLADIFGAERTGGWDGISYTGKYARSAKSNIRTWGQLGLTGEWADKPIQTYGYSAPGFAIAFQRRLFHWSDKWNENFKEYVEERMIPSGDPDGPEVQSERMYEALSKDKYGIAWGPILHSKDYAGVKQIDLAETAAGPYVALTEANVQNRTYPFIRDAYIYLNQAPDRPLDPKVAEFMRFIYSREGQELVRDHGMYYPLPYSMIKQQLAKIR